MNIHHKQRVHKLKNNSILSYRLDSEILLSKVLEKSRRVIIDQEEKFVRKDYLNSIFLLKEDQEKSLSLIFLMKKILE